VPRRLHSGAATAYSSIAAAYSSVAAAYSGVAAVVMAVVVTASLASAPGGQPPDFHPWIDTGNRAEVDAAYDAAFDRPAPPILWTGDHDACDAGDSSSELRRETLIRVAFYRAMAGVEATVVEDPEMSRQAQAAALMMSAEGELTHTPGADFSCFSPDGQQAAANSNLYLGRTGPRAIDGYIEDPGDRNIDVGHRHTILHPPTRTMGVGHVGGDPQSFPANALWVFDDNVFVDDFITREADRFVAWPPRGFVPHRLVYPRWSLALKEADFDQATVTMTRDGEPVALDVITRLSKDGEIPSSVIVWEPEVDNHEPKTDVIYTVTVSDVGLPSPESQPDRAVAEGPRRSFTYQVTVMGRRPVDYRSPAAVALERISQAALATVYPDLWP